MVIEVVIRIGLMDYYCLCEMEEPERVDIEQAMMDSLYREVDPPVTQFNNLKRIKAIRNPMPNQEDDQ